MKNGAAVASHDERISSLEASRADDRLLIEALCRKVDDVIARLDVLIDAVDGLKRQ